MAWIRTISPSEATGPLARVYEAAIGRAGKVWNILRIMSLRPRQLAGSMDLYLAVMQAGTSGLTRRERELVATVVSRVNECHY